VIPIAAPALPIDEAGKYVAGAYVVFLALLLIYVAIMSVRLGRIDRELGELASLAEQKRDTSSEHNRDTSSASRPGVSRSGEGRPGAHV
jgi:hypothetical protein